MNVDGFVGKVVKYEINGQEYKMRSPPAKYIPKLLSLQGKSPEHWTDKEWESLIEVLSSAVRKTYPEWNDEDIDDFVVQNFTVLQDKLLLAMGWLTEEQLENQKKNLGLKEKPKERPFPDK